MGHGAPTAAQWWTVPSSGQVSYLVGVEPELLSIALDPLPATAPAVVRFRPATGGPLGDQVAVLLDQLDRAALALFPRWLPGAEHVEGPQGLGIPAVRALAAQAAARSRDFGPFLCDLAERALRRRADGPDHVPAAHPPRFVAEVRAAGLARVIARAYARESTTLLIELPDELAPADEHVLVAAAEWLAHHGRLTVWLAGAALRAVDRVPGCVVHLPEDLTQLVDGAPDAAPVPAGPVLGYPPLSGLPRPDSAAEQALERALAPHEWASGRRWNHTYEWATLGRPYRLDIFWPVEGVVVEVDGPEHRSRLKYADDRRRDARLLLRGHAVLRFTNDQVLADVGTVVTTIQQLLTRRRVGTVPASR